MMKILITGMSSRHTVLNNSQVSIPLAETLRAVYETLEHDVVVGDPHLHDWTQFDRVIMGISPPVSLASNRVFPALRTIGEMFVEGALDRLSLMVDTPNTASLRASIHSAQQSPERLYDPSFSYRFKEFDAASGPEYKRHVLEALNLLEKGVWPPVYVPCMPWVTASPYDTWRWDFVPKENRDRTQAIPIYTELVFDLLSYIGVPRIPLREREAQWVAPANSISWASAQDTKWKTEYYTLGNMKSITQISEMMCRASGSLAPPNDNDMIWWSTHWIQSIAAAIPIATDWREMQMHGLGKEWMYLPAEIEEMTTVQRWDVAEAQGHSYFSLLPRRDTYFENLNKWLNIPARPSLVERRYMI